MIIMCDDLAHVKSFKASLQQQLQMKDFGPLWYLLGIEVVYGSRGYLLSRQKYIVDLISCVVLSDYAIVDTSM